MRSFVTYTHTRNYPGGQIEEDDIGGACNIHGGKQINLVSGNRRVVGGMD